MGSRPQLRPVLAGVTGPPQALQLRLLGAGSPGRDRLEGGLYECQYMVLARSGCEGNPPGVCNGGFVSLDLEA